MRKFFATLAVAVALSQSKSHACAAEAESIRIFKFDGTLQCGGGKEVPLAEMSKDLTSRGLKILGQEKLTVPSSLSTMCGSPTGQANVYRISLADLKKVRSLEAKASFAVWYFDYETVFVFKYDETLQCGMGKEITLEEMSRELQRAGVNVVSSAKGSDGAMHYTVCGGSTGATNVFEIKSGDYQKAVKLKFAFAKPGQLTAGKL